MHRAVILVAMLLLGTRALPAQAPITDDLACPRCTIETSVVVRLGAAEGRGELLGHPSDIVVDRRGRYWLLFVRSAPMVFDSLGHFVATVGRRGRGPGEFDSPWRALVVSDSVVVFDMDGRVTVVGPDLQPTRTIRTQGTAVRDAVAVQWPQSVLVSAFARSPDHVGWPLHLLDMSGVDARITRSFGEDDGALTPTSRMILNRHVIKGAQGNLWSADYLRYRLTQWNTGGQPVVTLLRQPEWFPGVSRGGPGSERQPPHPLISGLSEDRAGLLWVFTQVAASDWKAAWDRIRAQYGRPSVPPGGGEVAGHFVPNDEEIYDTLIEVIDPRTRAVVARLRLERYVSHILEDGRVALYAESPEGIPFLEIVRLNLRGR